MKPTLPHTVFVTLLSTAACSELATQAPQHEVQGQALAALCPDTNVFAQGLCVCDDFGIAGAVRVNAGASGAGGVGINGGAAIAGGSQVAGPLVAARELTVSGAFDASDVATNGTLSVAGQFHSTGNLAVGGDLTSAGAVTVDGVLSVRGMQVGTQITAASTADYAGDVAPPCGCDPATLFDVQAAVDTAQQQVGGNEAWQAAGEFEVTLQTGSYFITEAALAGASKIRIAGDVSLFIAGDLAVAGQTAWVLENNGKLDLYVSGAISISGEAKLGEAGRSEALRIYVGGSENSGLGFAGGGTFYGSIYAPRATFAVAGGTKIEGALFAKQVSASGDLEITHNQGSEQPTSCAQPPGAPSNPQPQVE